MFIRRETMSANWHLFFFPAEGFRRLQLGTKTKFRRRREEEDTENRRGRDHDDVVVVDDEFNDEKTDEETGFESTDDSGGV